MDQGISEVLPFAIGIAISPIPIIAIILILFSERAKVNGPRSSPAGSSGLTVAATVVYLLSQAADVGTDSSDSDTTSWGKILLGVVLLGLARRDWAKRPKAGESPDLPKWMATVETIAPARAFGLAVLLSVVNPKNLILAVGAAAGLGQLDLSTGDAVVSLVVFVVVASISVAFAVLYEFVGGAKARGDARRAEGVDDRAQPRGHGGAVPRVRRGADRQGDRSPLAQHARVG